MKHTTIFSLLCCVALVACGSGSHAAGQSNSGATSGPTYTPEGNSSTVVGIDSVGRGYRDDVQQLIDQKFSTSTSLRKTAQMLALTYQKSIATPLTGQDTLPAIENEGFIGVCASHTAKTYDDSVAALDALDSLYARTFNTDARMAARQAFLKAASGTPVGGHYDKTKCANL